MKKLLYRDRYFLAGLLLFTVIFLGIRFASAYHAYDENLAIEKMVQEKLGDRYLESLEMIDEMVQGDMTDAFDLTGKGFVIALLVVQMLKWILFDWGKGSEFAATLPVTRKKSAIYDCLLGVSYLVLTSLLYLGRLLAMQGEYNRSYAALYQNKIGIEYAGFGVLTTHILMLCLLHIIVYAFFLLAKGLSNRPVVGAVLGGWGLLQLHFILATDVADAVSVDVFRVHIYQILYTKQIPGLLLALLFICLLLLILSAVRLETKRDLSKGGAFQYTVLSYVVAIVGGLEFFWLLRNSWDTLFETAMVYQGLVTAVSLMLAICMGGGLFYLVKEK